MINRIHTRLQEKRLLLFALAMLAVYFLYLFYPLNVYLGFSLVNGVGMYSFAVLGAFYLYFRGARGGWALRFLLLYALWIGLSRFLCGDRALTQEGWQVVVGLLALCLAGLGVRLSPRQRERLLTPVAIVTAVFFTALGLMGLYASIARRTLVYSVTQSVTQRYTGVLRLVLLDYSPNIAAVWFLFSSALLLWLLLRAKRWFWKLLCLLALPIQAFTIAATYCRSCFAAYAVGAGLFAVLLGLRSIRLRGAPKAALLALLFALTVPLSYKGLELSFVGINALGRDNAVTEAAAAENDLGMRDLSSDGRVDIWKTMPEVLRREPLRLLRGCLYGDRMTITNELLHAQGVTQNKQSWHNAYLEILNYAGLPGLLCMLGFSLALALACLRLFFSPAHSLATRVLTLPVLGIFIYTQFESLLFFNMDYRSVAFYLLAGMVLGEAREIPARARA